MWYPCQNGTDEKPTALDQVSSQQFIFVRKSFRAIPASGEGESFSPAHWEWMETKVPKADWEMYGQVMEHGAALNDVYAALTELAEIIAGEE